MGGVLGGVLGCTEVRGGRFVVVEWWQDRGMSAQ